MRGLPLHHLVHLRGNRGIGLPPAQDLERVADGGERVAQLVPEQGQELVLGLACPPQLGLRLAHGGLGSLARDELADLAPHGGEELQQGLVGPPALPGEELDDPQHLAAEGDRKAEGGAETLARGDRRAREVRVVDDVGDPDRLARLPHAAGQAGARRKAVLARRGHELRRRGLGTVPDVQTPQLLAGVVGDPDRGHHPQGPHVPFQARADGLQDLGSRFLQRGAPGHDAGDVVVGHPSALGRVALRDRRAEDQGRERGDGQEHLQHHEPVDGARAAEGPPPPHRAGHRDAGDDQDRRSRSARAETHGRPDEQREEQVGEVAARELGEAAAEAGDRGGDDADAKGEGLRRTASRDHRTRAATPDEQGRREEQDAHRVAEPPNEPETAECAPRLQPARAEARRAHRRRQRGAEARGEAQQAHHVPDAIEALVEMDAAEQPRGGDGLERVAGGDREGRAQALVGQRVRGEGPQPDAGPGPEAEDEQRRQRDAGGRPDDGDLLGVHRETKPEPGGGEIGHPDGGDLGRSRQGRRSGRRHGHPQAGYLGNYNFPFPESAAHDDRCLRPDRGRVPPSRLLRPALRRRARRRRDGRAVVAGRRVRGRRPHRGGGEPAGRSREPAHRRRRPRGRARVHRHARTVGIQRARRSARREQDHAGDHHRADRRRQLHRPRQRAHDRGRPRRLGPLRRDAGVDGPGRLLPGLRAGAPHDQPGHVRGRGRGPRPGHRQGRPAGQRRRAQGDGGRGRPGDGAGRLRPLQLPHVRAGPFCLHRRADRSREGGRPLRWQLHHPPALGGRRDRRQPRRGLPHRAGGEAGRADLPPEDFRQEELGADAARAQADRGGARVGARRLGRHVPLSRQLERARRQPAAVGARGRPREAAGAAAGSRHAREGEEELPRGEPGLARRRRHPDHDRERAGSRAQEIRGPDAGGDRARGRQGPLRRHGRRGGGRQGQHRQDHVQHERGRRPDGPEAPPGQPRHRLGRARHRRHLRPGEVASPRVGIGLAYPRPVRARGEAAAARGGRAQDDLAAGVAHGARGSRHTAAGDDGGPRGLRSRHREGPVRLTGERRGRVLRGPGWRP